MTNPEAVNAMTTPLISVTPKPAALNAADLTPWALIAGPVILVATMSGSALAVTTGIAAGILLLGTAAAGFHDLARLRPASPARLSTKAR